MQGGHSGPNCGAQYLKSMKTRSPKASSSITDEVNLFSTM